jgi:hypothetical protein
MESVRTRLRLTPLTRRLPEAPQGHAAASTAHSTPTSASPALVVASHGS